MKKLRLLLLLLLTVTLSLSAQKLSKLPQPEREKKIMEIAKEVYKRDKFKAFYREYGDPKIVERAANQDNDNPDTPSYGVRKGEILYSVYFFYDMTKERMEEDFAAKVVISDRTGLALYISLGNMDIYPINPHKPEE